MSTKSNLSSDHPGGSAFGSQARAHSLGLAGISGNDFLLYAGWLLLVAGLAGWFSWYVACVVGGALWMAIGLANAYFVTWLSTKVRS